MDIDKLYLTTYNYKVNKDGTVTKDFGEEDRSKLLQNQLLDTYLSVLKDAGKAIGKDGWTIGRYIHILYRSIDNDTLLVENVLKNIESRVEKVADEPMRFGSLHTQVDIKQSFMTGKAGIAPLALNNNAQILTLLYNVEFKAVAGSILTEFNMNSLHEYNDRDGKSIMSWLSALINAHVDVAKDPYILRLNVNRYTWNLVSLLIRTGFGQDTFYFIDQPLFKDLANVYENANGSITEDPNIPPYERSKQAEREYLLKVNFGRDGGNRDNNSMISGLTDPSGDKETKEKIERQHRLNMPVYKALFGIEEDGSYNRGYYDVKGEFHKGTTVLEDVLTNPECLKDKTKPVSLDNLRNDVEMYTCGGQKLTPLEVQMYAYGAKLLFDEDARALSDIVQYTKIDTKGHGISYQELLAYDRKYKAIYDEAEKEYNGKKNNSKFNMGLYLMLNHSFINHTTRNAIDVLPEILGEELIHFTSSFQKAVDMICDVVHSRSKETVNAANEAVLTYIKQKCVNAYMSRNNISFNDMIYGDNPLIQRIVNLRRKMMGDTEGRYSEFVVNGVLTNNFLSNLQEVSYEAPYGQRQYRIFTLDNSQSDDNEIQDGYIDDWLLMWESDDEEVHNLAHDIAIYAFMTSGDTRGFNKFFKYVPVEIREAIGYTDYMEDMKEAFINGEVTYETSNTPQSYGMFNIDIEEILRNNWRNNTLIPQTQLTESYFDREAMRESWRSKVIGTYLTYKDVDNAGEPISKNDVYKIFAGIRKSGSIYIRTLRPDKNGNFAPFIKIRRPKVAKGVTDEFVLYQLVGVGVKDTMYKGRPQSIEYPIYAITYPKGLTIKAGSSTYQFYENDRFDNYTHLFNPSDFLTEEWRSWLDTQLLNISQFMNRETGQIDDKSLEGVLVDENGETLPEIQREFLEDVYKFTSYNVGDLTDVVDTDSSLDYNTTPQSPSDRKDDNLENDPQRFNDPKEDKDVISSKNTILSNEELAIWNKAGLGPMPRILVASERTDPAFHVLQILNVLDGKEFVKEWGVLNGKRVVVGNLTGKDFAGLYLITKHDGLPMEKLLQTKIPKLIHFSITGLGGTKYEPGVMKPDDLLDRIENYIQMGLDPNTITVRIDPIVPGVTTTAMIRNIVKRASEMGIKRIRFSIMDAYPNTVKSLSELGYDFERNYGINKTTGAINFNAKPEIQNKIVDFMLQLKSEYGITLGTCAEGLVREGISKEGCLSVDAVNRMLGTSIQDKGTENNTQRVLCSCYGGKVDVLAYKAHCASHCVYCYAKHENDKALQYYNEDGTLKDNVYTRTSINDNLPGPETVINIDAGTGENADLSNFAKRPFDFREGYEDKTSEAYHYFMDLHSFLPEKFDSVEQAFQAFTWAYALIDTDFAEEYVTGFNGDKSSESYKRGEKISEVLGKIVNLDSSAEIKKLGETRGLLNQEDIKFWDEKSSIIMKFLIKQSFKQNPQAIQRLLATGNATLTYTQDKSKWGTEFPRLLMEVRDELRAENKLNNQSNVFDNSSEFLTDEMNYCNPKND